MGIMNLTPDSFSHDGRLRISRDPAAHVRCAQKIIRAGADILDIGGESTRPGAPSVSIQEELWRILPTLRLLVKKTTVPISVDTYKPQVALAALQEGASIINTIKGVAPDVQLLKAVRDHGAAIVLMHMRGTPATMQKNPTYRHVVKEVMAELRQGIEKCLEIGIKKNRIIIDPGIGFSKTAEHNVDILRRLYDFNRLHYPILVGTSRKSFIGHIVGQEADRTLGTASTVCTSILNGAHIVRVHDVALMRQAAIMTDALI